MPSIWKRRREIGRQIRLRGIGGLIVVDFIHMGEGAKRRACSTALNKAWASTRPVQMSPMTEFGIVAITRKRLRGLWPGAPRRLRRMRRHRAGTSAIAWRWRFCAGSSARRAANPGAELSSQRRPTWWPG